MSNSDKDFITRIQVSQLVTDDPYADDFYFHIMAAIKASRGLPVPGMLMSPQGLPGQQGPGQQGPMQQQQGGNVNGNTNNNRRRNNGRQNAMDRMAQNVQRLVDSAKKRNEKAGGGGAAGHSTLLSTFLGFLHS
jgi:DNA topoisomerase 2-associated protein PAT1